MDSCSYDNEEELFAEVHNQQQNQDSTQSQVSFRQSIQPLLQANCNFSNCHAAGAPPNQGVFTNYAGVKQKVDNGSFKRKVIDPPREMPKNRSPLPESDIDKLKAWLNAGAPNN
tara:strand:- start:795 stop:1136 length:342 start_codon:yes stop_codon:yes gene_type:complete